MQDRLLNGCLAGVVEQAVSQAKAAGLKRETAHVEESLECAILCGPDAPTCALALFDFSQKLVDAWHRSNSEKKRQIVDCVSLNRSLDDVTLVLAK